MLKFGAFTLDPARAELTGPEGQVHIEPKVLNLLTYLAQHADRYVSKDEIIEKIWGGIIVSDSALSTAIKQARRAVGDTGSQQSVIRTVHGRGFRFVAEIVDSSPAIQTVQAEPNSDAATDTAGRGRPSLAVLPFFAMDGQDSTALIGDALAADVIAALSRLRWLFVISRASSFRFRGADADLDGIRKTLATRYVVTGTIERADHQVVVSVELLALDSGAVIWADRFEATTDAIHAARRQIAADLVSSLEVQIPHHEMHGALRLAPDRFDAWTHYHLGLKHLFRFNPSSNAEAARHFDASIALDPEFSRAHGGLSFAHWQAAFMGYDADWDSRAAAASHSAAKAVDIDPHDPFANFNMGRSLWLYGDLEGSQSWLDRALQVNPNFAQGSYARAWTHALTDRGKDARAGTALAMKLSPLDPLYYAMLCTNGITRLSEENFEDACIWTDRATRAPGAHFYINAIGSVANELAGNRVSAETLLARARADCPGFSQRLFFSAFPFPKGDSRDRFAGAFSRLGID